MTPQSAVVQTDFTADISAAYAANFASESPSYSHIIKRGGTDTAEKLYLLRV